MRAMGFSLAALYLLATSGCTPQVDLGAERAAIRDAEREAVNAANQKDSDRWVAAFAGEASVFPPKASVLTGKDAIREWGAKVFENPGFSLKFQNDKTEVSRAADIGYTIGRYEVTLNDPEGSPTIERGSYVTVFSKQPDGTWKILADIWNADEPAPASATE